MKQEIKTELYTSPEVEVIETKARQVVCASNQNAGNNGYGLTDYEW